MSENKKYSIIGKMSFWYIFRMLMAFIAADIVILTLCSWIVMQHAEVTIAEKAAMGNTAFSSSYSGQRLGVRFSRPIQWIFPEETQDAYRKFQADSRGGFWNSVRSVRYVVYVSDGMGYRRFVHSIGDDLAKVLIYINILAVWQLVYLMFAAGKGRRAIGKLLRPIADITETAKTMTSAVSGIRTESLEGTINKIDAMRPDMRLPIDETQKELRELSVAINAMLDRIDESYRSQIRFVSDASHELRTPIAVIQGYANLLDRWGKNDEKALQESIDAIKGEAANMKELVEQLLFLARGDNDSMKLDMQKINLSEIVSEVVKETSMIDTTHCFTANIAEQAFILGDGALIKQAARIFVDNSVKYTPPGGAIKVEVGTDGGVRFAVTDEGVGIAAEDLPHIFERFFRSDDSRDRKTGGTGLGLAIAKWIVEKHSGNVDIISRKDIGTRVTVTFAACGE